MIQARGGTDLAEMLATLEVERRAREYAYVAVAQADPALAAQAEAMVREGEGVTYVVPREFAQGHAAAFDFTAAWLTLRVHSALDAVGLTAAVAEALAARGIACNVLAGAYHDHLLVPADRADEAIAALHGLRGAR